LINNLQPLLGAYDISEACLLLAQSGHPDALNQCPLLGVKRTSAVIVVDRDFTASTLQLHGE
jgi:hypothetical protein